MLKKEITYEDFNGVTRTEDFYFNLTRTELAAMELDVPGGFSALLEGIIRSDNAVAVYEQLKVIIDKAYGVKSEDGRTFRKSEQALEDFRTSEAYDELVYGMIEGPDSLSAFIEGIMPKKLSNQVQDLNAKFDTREEMIEYLDQARKQ